MSNRDYLTEMRDRLDREERELEARRELAASERSALAASLETAWFIAWAEALAIVLLFLSCGD